MFTSPINPLNLLLSFPQVSVMQQELQSLQPELVQTSKETEELMIKIEKDTIEAEAKKEVSAIYTCTLDWETRSMQCCVNIQQIHVAIHTFVIP